MTTSLPHTQIRLRDLSELVAGIPYIIGFPPTDSLVLFTFHRCPDLVLSTTVRVDLPRPEHVSLVADEVSAAVARNEVVSAIAVVIGESGAEHGPLIDALREALADREIVLSHAFWVPKIAHGEQWQCYDDPLCADTIPDPQTSALAAAAAVAGDTAYPSREAMAAHLAPDPEEALARRKSLLTAYRPSPAHPYTDGHAREDLDLLGHALDMAMSSYDPPTLTDHQLVRLAVALSEVPVKDESMIIVMSDEATAAERLWTALVRALPAPERAEPAFLLALSAYLRGAGVLAALALEIVMESNPLHGMAVLVDYALKRGVPPNDLRTMVKTSIINNNEEEAEPFPEDDDPPWDTTSSDPVHSHTLWPAGVARTTAQGETRPPRCTVPSPPAASVVTRATEEEDEPSNREWFTGSPAMFSPPAGLTGRTEPIDLGIPLPPREELAGARLTRSMFEEPPGPMSQQAADAMAFHGDEPTSDAVTMDPLAGLLPPLTERSGPV